MPCSTQFSSAGWVLSRWSQAIQFPVQVVSSVSAIGAEAHGVKSGVAAPASTTTASPVPGPAPDGPLAAPHQLQVASIGVVMFGATRRPAYALPTMSLKRTTGDAGGPENGRM